MFLLRFPDEHSAAVVVELDDNPRGFSFSGYDGPPERTVTAAVTLQH